MLLLLLLMVGVGVGSRILDHKTWQPPLQHCSPPPLLPLFQPSLSVSSLARCILAFKKLLRLPLTRKTRLLSSFVFVLLTITSPEDWETVDVKIIIEKYLVIRFKIACVGAKHTYYVVNLIYLNVDRVENRHCCQVLPPHLM